MPRWIPFAVLCQFVLVARPHAALAAPRESTQQSASQAVIRGQVLDSSGGAIVGAQVTVTSERPGTPATTATNQQGEFELTNLPGTYTIRVNANGFVDTSRRLTLVAGEPLTANFTLAVAGVQESVSVGATIGYSVPAVSSATKTPTPLRDVPQAVSVRSSAATARPLTSSSTVSATTSSTFTTSALPIEVSRRSTDDRS